MTFAATEVKRETYNGLWTIHYDFTGASGDTGDVISTPLNVIIDMRGSGNLANGSANITGLCLGKTATKGQIRVTYTDPTDDHVGHVAVRGRL